MAAKSRKRKAAPKRKPRRAATPPAKLTGPMIQQMRQDFQSKPIYTVMQNAITHTSVDGLAWRHAVTKCNLDTDYYVNQRWNISLRLPWAVVDLGAKAIYLERELNEALPKTTATS